MSIEKYAISGGRSGRERLRILSRVLRPQTLDLFQQAGVNSGMYCLDLGCGGGDATFDLAKVVGAKGRAVGLDFDTEKLSIARQEAGALGLSNIEFRDANATDRAAEKGAFDFVYARQLTCHVPDPAGLLQEMIAYTKPGGLVALEDIHFEGYFSHPPCPALQRYMDCTRRTMAARGGNADIGPQLPRLMIDAGLSDVQMRVAQPAATQGEIKLIQPITMEAIAAATLADGLAEEAEIKEIVDELYAFAEDPTTVMSVPRYIQTWGRKA